MKSSKSSGRYALSLLGLAEEQGHLDAVMADMQALLTICHESHELELLLQSPIIKIDQKKKILTAVFEKHFTNLSLKFIQLITTKRRENILPQIAQSFVDLYKESKGIVSATVTTASVMSEAQKKEVLQSLKGIGKEVELIERVDPSILGGLKVRVGDRRIDASIRGKLNELKQELSK